MAETMALEREPGSPSRRLLDHAAGLRADVAACRSHGCDECDDLTATAERIEREVREGHYSPGTRRLLVRLLHE
jgi:hypothetical protein